jgi:signal transduction histidine kinase
MAIEQQKELLSDAFDIFRVASRKLEKQYATLEDKVEELNTELAEKNRAMERTRRLAAMGEMAARIAHEIRNPLGSMAIFSTLLERELIGDEGRRKLAESISRGVKTLDNILSNMLLFAASPHARCTPIDLKEVIADSVQMTQACGKAGFEIEHKGETKMDGDEGLLRQLCVNLLLNAVDSMASGESDGSGGIVTITTSVDTKGPGGIGMPDGQDMIEIRVVDKGAGISAEDLDRVFDPFFTTRDSGTGLGLAIVNSVVEAHNGTIDVTSEPGAGTQFAVRLPRNSQE